MTFLAPLFLVAGATVAGTVVLLHFLARRRPRPAVLPTARFVPDDPARWPSRAPRPTDWLLLALRVLAIMAIAAAFAQPVRAPARTVTARIVLVDRSRAIADERGMRDSVLALLREGDVMVAFDTATVIYSAGARDSAATLMRSSAPSSLGAALIAAERAAVLLRERADSVELAIVSSFAAESWDAATALLRTRWRGRARLVHLPLAVGDTAPRAVEARVSASDPVRASMAALVGQRRANARIVRGAPLASDSTWAREGDHALVHWPAAEDGAEPSAQAVVAGDVVLVAPLVRRALATSDQQSVVARFADGSAAIVEHPHGEGCIRDVAFDFPLAGDVPLRESSRRIAALLAAPCRMQATHAAMASARLDSLRGEGRLLATSMLPRPPRRRSQATAWLLVIGALLLLAEVAVRPRVASP